MEEEDARLGVLPRADEAGIAMEDAQQEAAGDAFKVEVSVIEEREQEQVESSLDVDTQVDMAATVVEAAAIEQELRWAK